MLDKCLREDFIAKVAEDAKTMQEQGGGGGGIRKLRNLERKEETENEEKVKTCNRWHIRKNENIQVRIFYVYISANRVFSLAFKY